VYDVMARRLLVATHNAGKVKEYAQLLSSQDIEWLSLADLQVTSEVEETGATFMDNACLKAAAYAREAGILTLADDSGLIVDALDGAPGVRPARYGGEGLNSRERYTLLLKNLSDLPLEERTARFRCAIALAAADGRILATSTGEVEGLIALEPRGEGGFGYDPVFYMPQEGRTMAQLPAAAKHAVSHRGRALRALAPQLAAVLGSG
jgi:XTP/dITP diphosphohydrolase